jgi:N-acetylmuramoyl-L-alanine amidase
MLKRGALGKKGQGEMEEEVYSVLIQVAILIMVVIAMMLYLKSVRDNTLFEKMYLSRDVALLMNTLYAAPENVGYVYAAGTTNLSKYTFKGEENYVAVNYEKDRSEQERYYKYASDFSFKENFPLIEDADMITFVKNDNLFKVGKDGTGSLNSLICQEIDTSSKNWISKVIIDPGHGYDAGSPNIQKMDIGYSNDKLTEYIFTTHVGTALKTFGYKLTRNSNYYLPQDERLDVVQTAETIISLHVGNYSADKNIAIAFISAKSLKQAESRKLACLILNNLLAQIAIENIAIIPVFPSDLSVDDPKHILLPTKVAVYLELGNINNKASVAALNPIEIANAINDALKVYYEMA